MAQTSSNNAEIRQKLNSIKYLSLDLEDLNILIRPDTKQWRLLISLNKYQMLQKHRWLRTVHLKLSTERSQEPTIRKTANPCKNNQEKFTERTNHKQRKESTIKNANSSRKSHTVITADPQSIPCDNIHDGEARHLKLEIPGYPLR